MTRVLVAVALVMLALWAVDHRAYLRGTASMSDAVTRARMQSDMLQNANDGLVERLESCIRSRAVDQEATRSALDGLISERGAIEDLALEAIRALESQTSCAAWVKQPSCVDI